MSLMASLITSLTIVYSIVYSGTDQRKHQSSTSLAFVQGIHQWLVNSPHTGPVTRKMLSFDDVIMLSQLPVPPGGTKLASWRLLVSNANCVNLLDDYWCELIHYEANGQNTMAPDNRLNSRHIDGLVQERRNSIANALELCLSCTNPSIYGAREDQTITTYSTRYMDNQSD